MRHRGRGGRRQHTGVGVWWPSLSLRMVVVAGAWTQVVGRPEGGPCIDIDVDDAGGGSSKE